MILESIEMEHSVKIGLKAVSECFNPADIARKLNVHKTFSGCPGRLLNVLCTFNFRPVSMWIVPEV